MGSQGPGRKRTPSKKGLTAEEDALNVIAREAEARLAAKRAARAEAREIRMKELERQQKEIYQVQKKYYGLDNLDNKWGDIEQWMEDSERYTRVSRRHASVSDDEERMSVGSRSNVRLDLDAPGAYGGLSQASSYSNKKSKKKKKHSSKTSNGYDDDLCTLSSRSSRLSDESKRSRSSRLDLQSSSYYRPEPNSSSSYSSKHQGLSYNGYQGSVYEDSVYSGSRRSSARASSEYTGFLGSSSRTSSRANSACGSPVADDRLERDYLEKGSSRASTISGATLTSLGGTSSRRGSGDTSISADTEASIKEIKEIHELKDQIQDVEAKHMQNLKELKDSLSEVEEKYRKAMVSNAQLDNEKTNLIYEVDTLKDSLMGLEEMLFETRRELEEKSKDLEREKHAHSILQFQFNELKETLKQSEELLTEIRQLRLKQDGFVREISDLQETIEWKNKKIGALERQKEFSDAIRNERDELRDEVVQLKDILKKHGIVLGPDLATNGETGEEVGEADQSSQTSPAEIREGSSVLGTHQMKMCKDRHQKYFDEEVQENQMSSHVPLSSTKTSLETNENEDHRDEINQSVEQQSDNMPEKPQGDNELTVTRPMDEIKSEEFVLEEVNTVETVKKCDVRTDGPMKTDQKKRKRAKRSQTIEKEASVESESGPILDEDQPGEDNKSRPVEEPVESTQTEKLTQTQCAQGVSNKKKKKKKKNKQKQKQSDKQECETKIDDKSEKVLDEDKPDQKVESDPEGNRYEQLGNNASMAVNTVVTADTDDKRNIEILSTNVPADDARGQQQVTPDVIDSAESSNPITNLDCLESTTDNNIPSEVSISNITDIAYDQIDNITNAPQEVSSENEYLLSCELSDMQLCSSDNIETSLLVDGKDKKSDADSDAKGEEAILQSIDPDKITLPGDHVESAPEYHPSSSVTEKVETDEVIQEQPTETIKEGVENHLQKSCEVDQTEVKTQQDESVEGAIIIPNEEVFSAHNNIVSAVPESQVQPILGKYEGEEEERSIHDQLLPDAQPTGENEADHESLKASDQENKLEGEDDKVRSVQELNLPLPVEIMVENVEEDEKEGSDKGQVVLDAQLPGEDEDILVEKVENEDKEGSAQDHVILDMQLPGKDEDVLVGKGEEEEKEGSFQDHVILDTQLSGEDEGILVESVTVSPELKGEDEEEDEGESFDFDDMDLEASHDPPKHFQEQLNEEVNLLKETETRNQYQNNAIDKNQTQEDGEPLKRADQESEPKKQMNDERAIENQQTTTEVEACLTEDNQVDKKDISGGKECTFEKHQQASEELRHNEGTDLISEIETRDVGQEINSSIVHENQGSKTLREQEVEKETAKTNMEDDRKESKKSSKKGKGKGKEECKMS